eukprot:TRINITY_DN7297_c0_g1_i1.p1 TRINITY_DN7297_c0_g1~~TRINITY_DN7297_c0_g1_i1.p1  ORF type:complete len:388 (+),score=152.48 TRINITY_DN7297_c0_g1_i1:39-1202(+)
MTAKKQRVHFADDEDSLLEEQRQFFESGAKSSAKSYRRGESPTDYNFKSNLNSRREEEERLKRYAEYNGEGYDNDEDSDSRMFTAPDFSEDEELKRTLESRQNFSQEDESSIHQKEEIKENSTKKEEPQGPPPKSQHQLEIEQLLEECRFDFQGNLLSLLQQESLPTHLGLHHHGKNADMAGYSFKEIFLLLRSTVPAQRTMNLKILNAIVTRAKSDGYVSQIGSVCSVLEFLVDNYDLPFVIFTAIDEKNLTTLAAAVQLAYNYLVPNRNHWTSFITTNSSHIPLTQKESSLVPSQRVILTLIEMEFFQNLVRLFDWGNEGLSNLVLTIMIFCSFQSQTISIALSNCPNFVSSMENRISYLEKEEEKKALSSVVAYLKSLGSAMHE